MITENHRGEPLDWCYPFTPGIIFQGPQERIVYTRRVWRLRVPCACGQLFEIVRNLQTALGERLRFVYRHYPLSGRHPEAQRAAEAAEAADAQGRFWEMHHLLFQNQNALKRQNLLSYAEILELDIDRFPQRAKEKGIPGTRTRGFPARCAERHLPATRAFLEWRSLRRCPRFSLCCPGNRSCLDNLTAVTFPARSCRTVDLSCYEGCPQKVRTPLSPPSNGQVRRWLVQRLRDRSEPPRIWHSGYAECPRNEASHSRIQGRLALWLPCWNTVSR